MRQFIRVDGGIPTLKSVDDSPENIAAMLADGWSPYGWELPVVEDTPDEQKKTIATAVKRGKKAE